MKIYAKTDIGNVREINQDYYYTSETEKFSLFVLADGMGGYTGGEIASKLATESVVEYINKNFDNNNENKEIIQNLINQAIEYANKIVYEKAKSKEELEFMGTTLEVCLIYKDRAYIGHIGDSRIYRIRQGIMRKLTVDHSYVQTLVKDGTITKEEAAHHPRKNMLMKALGCENLCEPDVMVKGFQEGDVILICSDGLTNMLEEEEIHKLVIESNENIADDLIQFAKARGGIDNITVIILKK